MYTLPYCRFSPELWDTPIGTHVLHMRASNLHYEHSFRRAYYGSLGLQRIATVGLLLVKLFKCTGTKMTCTAAAPPVAHPACRPQFYSQSCLLSPINQQCNRVQPFSDPAALLFLAVQHDHFSPALLSFLIVHLPFH